MFDIGCGGGVLLLEKDSWESMIEYMFRMYAWPTFFCLVTLAELCNNIKQLG